MTHEEIAAKLTQVLGIHIDSEFVARTERLSGKPILEMTLDEWERTAQLNRAAGLAARDQMEAYHHD